MIGTRLRTSLRTTARAQTREPKREPKASSTPSAMVETGTTLESKAGSTLSAVVAQR